MYALTDVHFEEQTKFLKKLYYKYNAKRIVVDGNGIGISIIDYMVKSQIDEDTGDSLPDFGIFNDNEGFYKQFRTNECEQDAIYIVKANAPINTEAYATLQTQLNTGKIKFLIDERVAKTKLMGTTKGQNMSSEKRAEYLKPYTLTSILKEEMLNLREENEGVNIILKRASKVIGKDKFSSLLYGIYYLREEEDNKKKKKKFNAKDWVLMN